MSVNKKTFYITLDSHNDVQLFDVKPSKVYSNDRREYWWCEIRPGKGAFGGYDFVDVALYDKEVYEMLKDSGCLEVTVNQMME